MMANDLVGDSTTDYLDMDNQHPQVVNPFNTFSDTSQSSTSSTGPFHGFVIPQPGPGNFNYLMQNPPIGNFPAVNDQYSLMDIVPPQLGCKLVILEEPASKFRFRYNSEMHGTHGSLMGELNQKSKKSFPKVELQGYSGGKAIVRCSLYQTDLTNPSPHSHCLVTRKGEQDVNDPHDYEIDTHKKLTTINCQGMGIIHTAKNNIKKVLETKLIKLQEFRDGTKNLSPETMDYIQKRAIKEASNMNLNQVRLCFEAFKINPDSSWTSICEPVYSNPINNMKSALTGEVKICRLSSSVSSAEGGEDLFLLVEKVNKKNIRVRFFEVDEDENVKWESYGVFSETDVHHQYAIALRTPAYENVNVENVVDVFIQLIRPSDNDMSERLPFKYKPRHAVSSRKRRRTSYSSMNSFELPESLNRNIGSVEPSENGSEYSNQTISAEFNKDGEINNLLLSAMEQEEVQQNEISLFINFVDKNSDELQKFMDPNIFSDHYIEIDGVSEAVNQNSIDHIISQSFKIFIDYKIQLIKIPDSEQSSHHLKARARILNLWNEFTKSNSTKDDVLTAVISRGNQKESLKIINIIRDLKLQNILQNENSLGETVLHVACLYEHAHIFIRILLHFGCDPNAQDKKGNTPLHIAVNEGFYNSVKTLLNQAKERNLNLEINLTNDAGYTPLHLAIRKKDLKIVQELIQVGGASAKVAISKNGNNALMLAVEAKQFDIVSYLVETTDVKLCETNTSGLTALDVAKSIDSKSEITTLLMRRMKLTNTNKFQPILEDAVMKEESSDEDSEESSSEKSLRISDLSEYISWNDKFVNSLQTTQLLTTKWSSLAEVMNLKYLISLCSTSEDFLGHLRSEKVKKQHFVEQIRKIENVSSEEFKFIEQCIQEN